MNTPRCSNSPDGADPAGAAARAGFYHLLALVFDHPVPEMHAAVCGGALATTLSGFEDALALPRTKLPPVGCGFEEFESAYISTFEIGARGRPVCSLHESDYLDADETDPLVRGGGSRTATFESLLRFYHHFDLRLTVDPTERVLPDHLCCELEMLAFLCFQERQAQTGGEAVGSYRLAQRDFLDHHVGVWLPRFVAMLHAGDDPGEVAQFFRAVATTLLRGVKLHRATPGTVAAGPQTPRARTGVADSIPAGVDGTCP